MTELITFNIENEFVLYPVRYNKVIQSGLFRAALIDENELSVEDQDLLHIITQEYSIQSGIFSDIRELLRRYKTEYIVVDITGFTYSEKLYPKTFSANERERVVFISDGYYFTDASGNVVTEKEVINFDTKSLVSFGNIKRLLSKEYDLENSHKNKFIEAGSETLDQKCFFGTKSVLYFYNNDDDDRVEDLSQKLVPFEPKRIKGSGKALIEYTLSTYLLGRILKKEITDNTHIESPDNYNHSSSRKVSQYANVSNMFSSKSLFSFTVYSMIHMIEDLKRSKKLSDFSRIVCSSVNGAVIGTAVAEIYNVDVIHLMNIGPRFKVRDKEIVREIGEGNQYLYVFDFVGEGTEYKITNAIIESHGSKVIMSIGVSGYKYLSDKVSPLFYINDFSKKPSYYYIEEGPE